VIYYTHMEKLTKPQNKFENQVAVLSEAQQTVIKSFSDGSNISDVQKIIETFNLSPEDLSIPEIVSAAQQGVIKKISDRSLYSAQKIIETFNLSPEFVIPAAQQGIIKRLSGRDIYDAQEIIETFNLSPEDLAIPEIVSAAQQAVIKKLSSGEYNDIPVAQKITETFNLSPEDLAIPEIVSVTQQIVINQLSGGYISAAKQNTETFHLSPEFIASPEVVLAAQQGVAKKLTQQFLSGYAFDSKQIIETFNLSSEDLSTPEIVSVAQQAVIKILSDGHTGGISNIKEIIETFNLSPEFIASPEVISAAQQGVIINISNEDIYDAQEIIATFNLSPELVISAAQQGVINKLSNGNIYLAQKITETFNLSPEFIASAAQQSIINDLSTGQIHNAGDIVENFKIPQVFFKTVYTENPEFDIKSKIFLQQNTNETLEINLKKTVDIFGGASNKKSYNMVCGLLSGTIDEQTRTFGVTTAGPTGINQLEQGFRKFKKDIIDPEFNPQIVLENTFASQYMQNYIRFTDASFTGGGRDFMSIVRDYQNVMEHNDVEPLNPLYTPSDILQIGSIDASKKTTMEYSEQFINRFTTLFSDIEQAKKHYENKNRFAEITQRLEEIKTKELSVLTERLTTAPEQAKKFIQQKYDELLAAQPGTNPRNIENFQQMYKIFSGLPGADSVLRQGLFTYAMVFHPSLREKDLTTIDTKNPQLDDITWTLNAIDHLTNQETFAKYFPDKHAALAFEKSINTRALSEELSKFRNQTTISTKSMQFIPTRGILMELSGHISDACWADKYNETIPLTFPNMTSVAMVQNPDSVHERIAGACMLIETTSSKGEPLLVIRGLNPLENVINQLSVGDFYEQFTNYIKTIAEKTGRKVAIVIDDHSGGSATNRPVLYEYLKSLELKRTSVPYAETEFNGYDITGVTFLVDYDTKYDFSSYYQNNGFDLDVENFENVPANETLSEEQVAMLAKLRAEMEE
jgi:hypothetical protein